MHIPKYEGQNLAYWCLHLWSVWIAFTCCCPLGWLPIWLQSEIVDPGFIHCHIYAKTLFGCIEMVANNALNQHIVFDQLWANVVPTLNTAFSFTNVHAKWWIHCFLISSTHLLSHATSIYDWPKGVWGVFSDNFRIWLTWAFSIICVCTTAFKVSIPPHSNCFWWISPNNIALLEQYFFRSKSNALSTLEIQIFPLFWKFAKK